MPIDLSSFAAVLLDLDGTIYHEDDALPGAVDLIRKLQADRAKFACLSNSTSSPARIVRRLGKMGVELAAEQVFTAAVAAVDFIREKFSPAKAANSRASRLPRVFNLATEGVADLLAGITQPVENDSQLCDAVVIGAPSNTHATLDRQRMAMVMLRRGATAVGVCADRVYPSPRGLELGSGALTSMLCYAADVQPVYCGKPEKFFFDKLCHHLNVNPQQCVLIGDNLESDVMGAKGVGMKTILTLSGITKRQDLQNLPSSRQPDAVIEDLTQI